jgi:hypothetical protein
MVTIWALNKMRSGGVDSGVELGTAVAVGGEVLLGTMDAVGVSRAAMGVSAAGSTAGSVGAALGVAVWIDAGRLQAKKRQQRAAVRSR